MKTRMTRDLVLSGLFIALGVLFPIVFHTFGAVVGQVFLPMHIPVLLAGFFLPPGFAFIAGAVTPLLSSVLAGMPPLYPMGALMAVELGVYALTASLMYRMFSQRNWKKALSVILSLATAMAAGRVAAGLGVWVLVGVFGAQMASPITYITGGVVTGLPGIAIQVVFVPVIVLTIGSPGRTRGK